MDLSVKILFLIQNEHLVETLLTILRNSKIDTLYKIIHSVDEFSLITNPEDWELLVADNDSIETDLNQIMTVLDQKELPLPCLLVDPQFPIEYKHLLRHKGIVESLEKNELNNLGDAVKKILQASKTLKNEVTTLSESPIISSRERHIEDFIKNAPIGIFHSSKEGKILHVNLRLADSLGYDSPEELIEKVSNISSDIYADAQKRTYIVERLITENNWVHEEIKMKRKDGTLINVDFTGRKVLENDGSLLYFEGFVEDITEKKRAEEALRRSENQFRAFFEEGSDGVVTIDPTSGNFVDFNNQACLQLGYTREEFAKLNLADIEAMETPEMVTSRLQNLREVNTQSFETKHRTKQGEIRNVQVNTQVIEVAHQPIFYSIWRDITEHKQKELSLELHRARLLEAQSVSNTGSWDLDLISKEMWGSEEAHNIYGLEITAGLRLPLTLAQNIVEPEFRPMMDQALTDLITSKGTKPYDVEFYIHRHNDGTRRAIHSRARLVCDTNGKPLRVAGTIQDITDRKQIDEDIRRMNNELEQRVKERTNQLEVAIKELEAFSYSVSHDLRAPLRTLNGYSSILVTDYAEQLDEQAKSYLRQIQHSANLMDQLINDMHNLSRITRAEMVNTTVNLSEMAREIGVELQKQTPQQKMEFSIENKMEIQGDSNLLRIMLENMMSNAVKFSSKNESGSKIQVGKLIKNGHEVYYVRDNGVGFDMAFKEKLFQPFQRLHGVTEFPGTGIGLSIVQRIIQRHNGRIWAESTRDQGATFYFTIG